jgi:transcriptional regulator of met regulon
MPHEQDIDSLDVCIPFDIDNRHINGRTRRQKKSHRHHILIEQQFSETDRQQSPGKP